ncbi:pilin [Patescibacteria group bacterium]|nr:pilin [Patescibacteria group bacterium]
MTKVLIISFAFLVISGAFVSTAAAQMPNFNLNIWQGTGRGSVTCNETAGTSTPAGCSICDGVIVASNIVNNIAVPLGIIAAVVFIVYGALRMMTAFGSESNFGDARKIITSAIIGLVIILCGWLIVNTFFHIITGGIDFPWAQIKC